MDFTRNQSDKNAEDEGQSQQHQQDQEEASENPLYDLLDAQNLNSLNSLNANLQDNSVPFMSSFTAFAEDCALTGDGAAGISNFRSAADVLNDAHVHDEDRDVYRSVVGVDFGSQFQTAITGEQGLDVPVGFGAQTAGATTLLVQEPEPRLFSGVDLSLTHLYIGCPLQALVSKIDDELRKQNVDFSFNASKCLWRCMCYPKEPSAAVDFRVHLNSTPKMGGANRYVAEFIRRDGDASAFHHVFGAVRDKLILDGVVTTNEGTFVKSLDDLPTPFSGVAWSRSVSVGSRSSASSGLPSLPAFSRSVSTASSGDYRLQADFDFDNNSDDEDEEEAFSAAYSGQELYGPLMAMAESKFQDVHVQGMALISHECKKGANECKKLVETFPRVIELMVARALSAHREVKRHAVTTLASIAGVADLRTRLIECQACLPRMAEIAVAPYSTVTAESQRQAVQGLLHMAQGDEASIVAVAAVVTDKDHAFAALAKSCNDARLIKLMTDVRAALGA
jgi:hypothetical protein